MLFKSPNEKYTPWLNIYRERFQQFFYVPFIMHTYVPKFRSDMVNTDRFGFRHTIGSDGKVFSFDHLEELECVNLLLGGSVSFSWGATNDRRTISSELAGATNEPWLNMGIGAYTIQHSLIQLMFLSKLMPKIKRIVFLGGFNEIAAFVNGYFSSPVYGSIFDHKKFHDAMNDVILETLPEEYLMKGDIVRSIDHSTENFDIFKQSISYALDLFSHQALGLGATPHFVFQPYPPWMSRALLKKEQEIWKWHIKRHVNAVSDGFYDRLKGAGDWYSRFIGDACKMRDISFLDLCNELSMPEFADDWLFIDQFHLTDECNKNASSMISRIC